MKFRYLLPSAARMFLLLFAAATANAGTIEVDRQGAVGSRPVIFIPGLASSASLWSPWAKQYSASHDVHVVGVRGFAGVPVSGPLTIAAIADDLANYLADNELHNAVIVGHSVGGMIALQTANRSDRVGELVLVDSVPFTAGLFVPGVTPEGAAEFAAGLRTSMRATPVEAFRAQQRAGLAVYSKTEDFLPILIDWSDSSDVGAVTDVYTDLLATDYRAAIADIGVPIHVLAAWDVSMNVPREQIERIFAAQYEAHGKAEIRVIEDSLHFIMIDQPEAFASVLDRVLGE